MSEDILKYIKLGTDYKEYFNYDGSPLPIRPLSTYELDLALRNAIKGISPLVFENVIKTKLNLLEENEDIDLTKENYQDFLTYWNEIDYWTVYFSMKDFQSEEFSMPDYMEEFKDDFEDWVLFNPKGYYIVRKMKYIHTIAENIISMTSQPTRNLMEVLKNNQGKVLGTMIHQFHIPLTSEAWKLTPLQSEFIYYTRSGAPVIIDSTEDLPGIKGGTFEEIMQQLGSMGFDIG